MTKLSTSQESILCRMINGAVLRWTPEAYICGDVKVHDRRTIHGLQGHGFIERARHNESIYEITEAGRKAYARDGQ